ncbi:MAG: glycoside hydrolase family 3 C-terminal domain-containing protein [Clostridia bacterium]|nr:glycoside hydrolase family 3 C-terminal domain-containing protein [Clostridia bacterium]
MIYQGRLYSGQEDERVTPLEEEGRKLSRRAAAAGMVLLENDGVLPLKSGTCVGLFGLGARHTVKGGTGSGDVCSRHVVSVAEGMEQAGIRISSRAYLDAVDAEYDRLREEWINRIYEAAGPEKDTEKLYDAHARYVLETPSVPIRPEDIGDADVLVYVLSRTSGEGADRRDEPGDYYLSHTEEEHIRTLAASGKPLVLLLNVGGVMDLSILDSCPVSAVLLMGQAGCDSGGAAVDILTGAVNPSGCLTDTWASHYLDYPSSAAFSYRNGNVIEEDYTDGIYVGYRYFDSFGVKPRYPFGYGLSYTTFSEICVGTEMEEDAVRVSISVCNTGRVSGAHAVLLYAACPMEEQKKEFRRLVAFEKTRVLSPGESETLELRFTLGQLVSFREGPGAYALEKGTYLLMLGCTEWKGVLALEVAETQVMAKLHRICEQLTSIREIEPTEEQIKCRNEWIERQLSTLETIQVSPLALEACRRECAPVCPDSGDLPEGDVLEREAKRRVQSLTEKERIDLVVGSLGPFSGQMIGDSGKKVPGAAGETVEYPDKGIPGMTMADGPAGLRLQLRYEINPEDGSVYRMNRLKMLENRFFGKMELHEGAKSVWQFATAIPTGTLLAQTFDLPLLREVGAHIAREMQLFRVALWLAPGMNIHRNPLCGRNFEYFSEDPFVSGMVATALTQGVQETEGLGTTIKHLACNNQEDNRMGVSANVRERTLREIYLKGFEMAVKRSQPVAMMTSYNRVNGVHTANSRDLCTTLDREEWGFDGLIMSDWTTTNTGHGSSAAKAIRAGNDLIMPGRLSDQAEIRRALHGEGNCDLSPEDLFLSCVRIVKTALRSERAFR